MEAENVKLGLTYRDSISGWVGVATGRYEYLNGCVRVELSSVADGKPEGFVFDTQQLEPADLRCDEPADGRAVAQPDMTVAVADGTPIYMHPDGRREPMRPVGPGKWAVPEGALATAGQTFQIGVDAPTAAEAMAAARGASRPRPQAEAPPDPRPVYPVHPLVRFWRWLWNPPTPEPWPGLVVGKMAVPDDFDPGPVPMPTRTGGPRSTPPRTSSR